MAADAGVGARAFGHQGRAIVRAAGAEIGRARGRLLDPGELGPGGAHARQRRFEIGVGTEFQQPFADRDRDLAGIERALRGKQPLPRFVALADDHRLMRRPVELLANLHLDERALFLDDDDQRQARREFAQTRRLDRPGAAELIEAQAQRVAARLVEAEIVERLAHVEIGLAERHHADLGIGAAREDDAVEPVGGDPGDDRGALFLVQARFLRQDAVVPADVEAARRRRKVARLDRDDAVERCVDHGGRFDGVLDAFQADPDAGVAAERPAERAVIEDFLHAGRRQHRHHRIEEGEFRLMGGGGGFGGGIVAHQRQHAAVARGPREIGVAEDVAGAIDARTLAVPQRVDAVEAAFAAQLRLLGSPDRGRRQLLVEAGLEMDVVGGEKVRQFEELLIEPADRRAAIARNEAAGVEPDAPVALLLLDEQARDRLRAVEQHARLRQVETVGESHRRKGIIERRARSVVHGRPPDDRARNPARSGASSYLTGIWRLRRQIASSGSRFARRPAPVHRGLANAR